MSVGAGADRREAAAPIWIGDEDAALDGFDMSGEKWMPAFAGMTCESGGQRQSRSTMRWRQPPLARMLT